MANLTLFKKKETVLNQVLLISIHSIIANKSQPRKIFDESELEGLTQSIKLNGVLQPITIKELSTGKYELIAGERRLRATKLAGINTIPAIVLNVDDKQSALLALLENLQRKNLHFLEQAESFNYLITQMNMTQQQIAENIGKSQASVANKLRLLKLENKIKEKIISSDLTERHARSLLTLKSTEKQETVINTINEKKLNVNQTENLIKSIIQQQKENSNKTVFIVNDIRLFINTISKAVDQIKKAGINATTFQNEKDDIYEYIINIPKH